jgi:hypothetical protein
MPGLNRRTCSTVTIWEKLDGTSRSARCPELEMDLPGPPHQAHAKSIFHPKDPNIIHVRGSRWFSEEHGWRQTWTTIDNINPMRTAC